jgi:thiamine transport system substrate-binding protein
MKITKQIVLSILMLALSACKMTQPRVNDGPAQRTPIVDGAPGAVLNVMVHDSFGISDAVLQAFEQANGVKVNIFKSGDAGALLNKAILSKDAPIADVVYGVDNTFMSRALAQDIFTPYASPALAGIPDSLKLDASNRLLPVDYGYVSFNIDMTAVQSNSVPLPTTLRDLTQKPFQHKVVVQNAAQSSPGLAMLLTTIAAFPAGSNYPWQQFWRDMTRNLAHVSPDWTDAYQVQFSGSSGKGPHPVVVSYATSPAAEVFYSEGKLSQPPTANLDIGAWQQIEFVGILKSSKNVALAQRFVDFMLGPEYQKDFPTLMWVYPAVATTPLPDVFKFATVPSKIYALPPQEIDANRERWIAEWTQIVAGN